MENLKSSFTSFQKGSLPWPVLRAVAWRIPVHFTSYYLTTKYTI